MAAAESIQVVDSGGIVFLVGSLDTALGHHGVGIAHAQLGDDHYLGAGVVSLDSGRGTGTATTDNQHVGVVIDLGQIDIGGIDTAICLQQRGQLGGDFTAFVGADSQLGKLTLLVVGVVGLEQCVFFFGSHAAGLQGGIGLSRGRHFFHGLDHFVCVHQRIPPYFSISRWL